MDTLTDIDARILEYVSQHRSVHIDSIKKDLSDISSVEYRIELLSTPEYAYVSGFSLPIPKRNTSYLTEYQDFTLNGPLDINLQRTGYYQLTELGQKELQDYLYKKKTETKELWLKNAWIPIIVSFVTTVITNYILPKLPQIIKWLSDILSKTSS